MIKRNKKYLTEILLITPLVLYLFTFTLLPIINAVHLSFMDGLKGPFPSLANYSALFTHFQFREAVFNTLFVTIVGLALELTLGLGLALLLWERIPGRRFFRALMLLPLGIPTIVVASNMRYIFDTNGFLNELLFRLRVIDVPVDWMGGGLLTLFSLVVSDMWKVTPLVMLILLAGLESIPREVLEAAETDGASYFGRLRMIVLPMLKPFITMAIIIRGIDAFRIFELPLALTGRITTVLATYSYFEYREYGDVYAAAASSTILMLIVLAAISVYLKMTGQKEASP